MEKLREAIADRNLNAILSRLFTVDPNGHPKLRSGFGRESELWDFKRGLPGMRTETEPAWADVAADVAALHNVSGGVLFFGIRDDLSFEGTRDTLDAKRFNDKIRRYLGDTFWVVFSREYIQADQSYLGVALVPPKNLMPVRMRRDAPPRPGKAPAFGRHDLAVREGDSTRIYKGLSADDYLAKNRLPSADARFLLIVKRRAFYGRIGQGLYFVRNCARACSTAYETTEHTSRRSAVSVGSGKQH